jgi:DNA repair protein RadC
VNARLSDRPRERLRREGAQALSVTELLRLILGAGSAAVPTDRTATELLQRFGSLEGLERAGDAELASVPGIGPARIAGLRAAFEVGGRLARGPLQIGERLGSPEQVYRHFGARLRRCRQERFLALLVDSRHRLVAEVEVSRGSLNQSLVHPREVFAPAVRESAAAVLALHNHPSGDPSPSREEHEVTRRLAEAGEILGIRLLDHVVIGGDGFTSFARDGWLEAQGGWRPGR